MDRPWKTGFFKEPVAGPVAFTSAGADGDEQADRVNHGGPDKAVLADSADHYLGWRTELEIPELPFGAFAENILDKLRIWAGELTPKDVVFHDYHIINDQVLAGRGGLIFVTHLGNVEVTRALPTRKNGVRLTVLVHTKHAETFNALLAEFDPASTMNILQVTDITADTVIRLRERVDRGEYIVIAADRVPIAERPRVAPAEFLGAPAGFPVGPYVLASLLQCPTYLLFCIPERGTYHVYFEHFHERIVLPRLTRDAALRKLAAEFAGRLAHYCQRAPLQWFNFYDFWDMSHSAAPDATR